MMKSDRQILTIGVALAVLLTLIAPAPADEVAPDAEGLHLFEAQIRPVLLDHCIKCHGEEKPKGGFQILSRDLLLKGGGRGPAAVPGDTVQSLMLQALRHEGELKMPRDGRLTGEQVKHFERWVAMGLPWPADAAELSAPAPSATEFEASDAQRAHWSFQPLKPVEPPPALDPNLASDVDRFILAKLQEKGLNPVAPADKRTLIRRATFDLTGLPPTPEEIDAFLADAAPDAFAKVVDRLLASPAYGERWGRHWLDVARYADTAGETADYPVREAYKYRNWVIDAFNRDLPYDQFVREQVAGDILAREGPPEQFAPRVTATGFLALSRRFGYDSEKYHHLAIQDTIDTLGQAVLGLTIGCARCHDHKYDPISAADYYALYGIFESTRYAFPGSEQKQKTRVMAPLLPPAEARAALATFDQKLAAVEALLAERKVSVPRLTVASVTDIDGDFDVQARANGGSLGVLVPPWLYTGSPEVTPNAQSPYRNVYARVHRFDHVVGTVGVKFPAGEEAHSIRQALRPARTAATHERVWVNLDFRNVTPGPGAWRLCLGEGPESPAVEVLVNGEALLVRNGSTVESVAALRQGEWYNLQLEIDLDSGTFGGTLATPVESRQFTGMAFTTGWKGSLDHVMLDNAGHVAGVRPERDIDNFAVSDAPLRPIDAETASPAGSQATAAPQVAGEVTSAGSSDTPSDTSPDSDILVRRLYELTDQGPCEMAYAVAEATPIDSRIQIRGEPDKPGPLVPRRFLTILGGDPLPPEVAKSSSGRLQLAEWLTRPANPLTARVMVNRIWQHHFGQGLVQTPNDFGLRGKPPTHPQLLDWLSSKFIESGWSVKAMHRLLMLSSTYQLSGELDPEAMKVDPSNKLLWRFSRRRLEAEAIRDAMLAVAGNLDRSPGGSHPFPPPETWGFSQHGPFAAVYETNRRSVYLMTQRLKRHPFLALFDGADTNASTALRPATTVPTQALFMMNSAFVHEQSAGLAQRVIASGPDVEARVRFSCRLTLGREPSAEETAEAGEFLRAYAEGLATAGVPADQHEPLLWAAYCRTLLVCNEFLFVD